MEVMGWNAAAMLLFVLEAYHVMGHTIVLCRLRLLPRKDLVRMRVYFLLDGLTSFVTAFVYTGRLRWLVALHVAQHLYYYMAWEKTHWAKRIVDWSSLDWFQSPLGGGREMDNILGTLFDIAVHVANLCILASYLSTLQVLLLLGLAGTSILAILFNPRFAWGNPSSALPAWIQKRISPLPGEKVEAKVQ